MKIADQLRIKLKANVPLIQIISHEWQRIFGLAILITSGDEEEGDRPLYRWNLSEGLFKLDREEGIWVSTGNQFATAFSLLEWYKNEMEEYGVLLIEDLHPYFGENFQDRPRLISMLKSLSRLEERKSLILLQPVESLPPELEKEIYIVHIPLPNKKLLRSVLDKNVIRHLDIPDSKVKGDEELNLLAEAALGLTIQEAASTFKEIYMQEDFLGKEQIPSVIMRKEQIIKKSGILEYFHQQEQFSDVGGMENLKDWLKHRRNGFTEKAQEIGLIPPKGVLLLGIPGCGKSLIAKAIASSWDLPLLKFDVGKVFGGIVGQSEQNIREAISIANAVAPSILWIDEIEKGLSGLGSSNMTDGGVTSRIFGTLLTWMQEKKEPVFVIATANDVTKLPPELLRKGRFDEIFFVDLPGDKSRMEIWNIHLKRRLKDRFQENVYDLDALVKQSLGYSGAEIEEAVNSALYSAFADNRDLATEDLINALKETYPLSKVMADGLSNLRKWAEVRARSASRDDKVKVKVEEKIPKLKSEANTMWIE